MNKVILMGRLTRDPKMTQAQNSDNTVARYTLAVDRRTGRNGEQTADFIDCVAFGASAKFVERYFRKGRKVVVCGRIQSRSYTNKDGQKVYVTDVVTNEHYFADDKIPDQENNHTPNNAPQTPDIPPIGTDFPMPDLPDMGSEFMNIPDEFQK